MEFDIGMNFDVEVQFDLASLDLETLKELTASLHKISDRCSIAVFNKRGVSATGIVLFCGNMERFKTLSLVKSLRAPLLVAQDPLAPWFTGSRLCGGVDWVMDFARRKFPYVRRWLFTGQSSGGYAALLLSRQVEDSVAIAFSPQTFDDRELKSHSISFPVGFNPSMTNRFGGQIKDLREIFFSNPLFSSQAYVISSYSEHSNPPTQWLWLDAMHWGRIVDHPNVRVFLTDSGTHTVLFRRAAAFGEMLQRIIDESEWSFNTISPLISAVTGDRGIF